MDQFTPGNTYSGFKVLSVKELKEYNSTGLYFEHTKTGSGVYHIHNEDKENFFALAFKTPPYDNTGVAHILEHSVLCGSEKYPLKDPFVVLSKTSLKTFLNAFTYPDKTVYPGSSTVEKDFFNLFSVYGDAVFFPLLNKEVFLQEGNRFEFSKEGKLTLNGVVYNEMKGNYSDQESIAAEWSYRSLFTDHPYYFDSGGMPENIPDLTYEAFLDYHKKWYHPSNCLIFLYGSIDTKKHLDFLENTFLSRFEKLDFKHDIPVQKKWEKPVTLTKTWPSSNKKGGQDTTISLNWVLSPIENHKETIILDILTEILIGHPGSPLEKAIIDSKLGDDISPISGLEIELRETIFTIAIRGTSSSKTDQFDTLVTTTLQKIIDKGISRELIEAAIRSVEFSNKEIHDGPFGLRLMRRSLRGWLHGFGPETTLEFSNIIEEIRSEFEKEPHYFEKRIKKYLLENNNKSRVIVKPDPNQRQQEEKKLNNHLETIQKGLTETEIETIKKENDDLKVFQSKEETEEDLKVMPTLELSDVPKKVETIPVDKSEIMNVPVYEHTFYTNGITYLDFSFDLQGLDAQQSFLVPLFAKAITNTGLPGIPYDKISHEITLKTGGFYAYPEISSTLIKETPITERLFIRVKILNEYLKEAIELITEIIKSADLTDLERIENLILELRNDIKSSITSSGSTYASRRCTARLSPTAAQEENWRGINQFFYINEFIEGSSISNQNLKELSQKLISIQKQLINKEGLLINITTEETCVSQVKDLLTPFISQLPSREIIKNHKYSLLDPIPYEAIAIPGSVGFNATAFNAIKLTDPQYPHMLILTHLLRTGFLWENVRMKGGAYGAYASITGLEGLFSFVSYRDPQIDKTYKAYKQSLEYAAQNKIDKETMRLAIIGTIGRDLKPFSPGEKGTIGFKRLIYGIDDNMRQQKREILLQSTAEDIQKAAQFALEKFTDSTSVTLSNIDLLKKSSQGDDYLVLKI